MKLNCMNFLSQCFFAWITNFGDFVVITIYNWSYYLTDVIIIVVNWFYYLETTKVGKRKNMSIEVCDVLKSDFGDGFCSVAPFLLTLKTIPQEFCLKKLSIGNLHNQKIFALKKDRKSKI